jgi:hypothetical protein
MTKFSQNVEQLQSAISTADEQHKKEVSIFLNVFDCEITMSFVSCNMQLSYDNLSRMREERFQLDSTEDFLLFPSVVTLDQ